jgi:hypothetical protein
MTKQILFVSIIAAALAVGCDDKSAATAQGTGGATANAAPALPANLRLAASPADAKEIAAVKSSVKDGDKIVVSGVVAGRGDPIAENRAILTLLDTSVRTCDKNPDEGCKTPWDACCEPADVLAKNSVTVQVVDADGRPLKTSLAGVEGVKPLAKLVVSGTAKVSADGVVLVNADGLHVVQ